MNIQFTQDELAAEMAKRRKAKSGAKVTPDAPQELEPSQENPRHYLYDKVKSIISLRLNCWLTGPAGSGKSKLAEQVAEELQMRYAAPPIGRETPMSQLFGYFNAKGEYVRTPIRECAEFGGVLHLEEIDFASPAVGTALNALLANDKIGFPDQAVQKHKDFIVIASANTYGSGATAQYIGSQGLNAATLDRFVFLDFPYDEKLERCIAPNAPWARHVQAMRLKANSLGIQRVISPRATIQGGHLINSGAFTWEEVEQMTLWRNLDAVTIAKIKSQEV